MATVSHKMAPKPFPNPKTVPWDTPTYGLLWPPSSPGGGALELARPDVGPHSTQAGQYGPNGTACAPCSVGHFKDWIGEGGCSACPDKASTLLAGSTSGKACACGTGYAAQGGAALDGLACVNIDECTGPPPPAPRFTLSTLHVSWTDASSNYRCPWYSAHLVDHGGS